MKAPGSRRPRPSAGAPRLRGRRGRRGRRAQAGRGGYSLVELLIAATIIGLLAAIAVPTYQRMTLRARAAQALGDINAVRVAAFAYNAETGEWPDDVNRGILPPELAPYLGDDFSFDREGYRLDWDNWVLPDGSPLHPDVGTIVGVSVATDNTALGHALLGLVGDGVARYTLEEHYTIILASD